jgi:aspartyl-tRNA(Asn)/glutamyl-tRNA(Gln) amidotransferase subunit B
MSDFEAVIGLEVHAQLACASKIFSLSSTAFGASPNAQASAIDLAMPGTLPLMNERAVEMAIRFGLAVNAEIAERSVFERKNYFYPDLPKGYQISQYLQPIVKGGSVQARIKRGDTVSELTIPLTRAHLEEDAGKSVHDAFYGASGIDLNRAGTPLLEIVTEPCMHSPEEAVAYLKALHTLVKALKICDGNMQEGSFRCDANVSVRKRGEKLGTRAEIKNVNSFRFVEKAIAYEIDRQIRVIESGGSVVQETRLFDSARGETRSMRSKENADDYRYFPDPDLPPLVVSKADVERVRAEMPELPLARRTRYINALSLSDYEADTLALDAEFAEYFEASLADVSRRAANVQHAAAAKNIASLMMGELAARLNQHELEFSQLPVSPTQLASVSQRVLDQTLNNKLTKQVLDRLWTSTSSEEADQIIDALGLRQISDAGALATLLDDVIAQNAAQVTDFRNGNEKILQFLIGQAMKASKGKANAGELTAMLKARLSAPDA